MINLLKFRLSTKLEIQNFLVKKNKSLLVEKRIQIKGSSKTPTTKTCHFLFCSTNRCNLNYINNTSYLKLLIIDLLGN